LSHAGQAFACPVMDTPFRERTIAKSTEHFISELRSIFSAI
jgi:hypothetical protein